MVWMVLGYSSQTSVSTRGISKTSTGRLQIQHPGNFFASIHIPQHSRLELQHAAKSQTCQQRPVGPVSSPYDPSWHRIATFRTDDHKLTKCSFSREK